MGTQLRPQNGAQLHSPQFSAHVYCGQTAGCIRIPLGTEVGLGTGDVVLDEKSAPPKRGIDSPRFSAHVRCGQTAGWINTPLGTEVDLGPGHIVLDGDPAPLEGGTAALPTAQHLYS